jgi:hypothetical protein
MRFEPDHLTTLVDTARYMRQRSEPFIPRNQTNTRTFIYRFILFDYRYEMYALKVSKITLRLGSSDTKADRDLKTLNDMLSLTTCAKEA